MTRRVLAAIAVALIALFAVPAAPAMASAQSVSVISDGNGNCLTASGTAAVSAPCASGGEASQSWDFTSPGKIQLDGTSEFLHGNGAGFTLDTETGALVLTYAPGHVLESGGGRNFTWCGGTGTQPYLASPGAPCQETYVFTSFRAAVR